MEESDGIDWRSCSRPYLVLGIIVLIEGTRRRMMGWQASSEGKDSFRKYLFYPRGYKEREAKGRNNIDERATSPPLFRPNFLGGSCLPTAFQEIKSSFLGGIKSAQ